jgi:hypothetical protein
MNRFRNFALNFNLRLYIEDFDNRLNAAWTTKTLLRATVETDADTEMALLLDYLSSLSPVTFFEINQIKGKAWQLSCHVIDTHFEPSFIGLNCIL